MAFCKLGLPSAPFEVSHPNHIVISDLPIFLRNIGSYCTTTPQYSMLSALLQSQALSHEKTLRRISYLLRPARRFHFQKVNGLWGKPIASSLYHFKTRAGPRHANLYMPLAGVMSAVNSPGQARERYLCRIVTKSDYDYEFYEDRNDPSWTSVTGPHATAGSPYLSTSMPNATLKPRGHITCIACAQTLDMLTLVDLSWPCGPSLITNFEVSIDAGVYIGPKRTQLHNIPSLPHRSVIHSSLAVHNTGTIDTQLLYSHQLSRVMSSSRAPEPTRQRLIVPRALYLRIDDPIPGRLTCPPPSCYALRLIPKYKRLGDFFVRTNQDHHGRFWAQKVQKLLPSPPKRDINGSRQSLRLKTCLRLAWLWVHLERSSILNIIIFKPGTSQNKIYVALPMFPPVHMAWAHLLVVTIFFLADSPRRSVAQIIPTGHSNKSNFPHRRAGGLDVVEETNLERGSGVFLNLACGRFIQGNSIHRMRPKRLRGHRSIRGSNKNTSLPNAAAASTMKFLTTRLRSSAAHPARPSSVASGTITAALVNVQCPIYLCSPLPLIRACPPPLTHSNLLSGAVDAEGKWGPGKDRNGSFHLDILEDLGTKASRSNRARVNCPRQWADNAAETDAFLVFFHTCDCFHDTWQRHLHTMFEVCHFTIHKPAHLYHHHDVGVYSRLGAGRGTSAFCAFGGEAPKPYESLCSLRHRLPHHRRALPTPLSNRQLKVNHIGGHLHQQVQIHRSDTSPKLKQVANRLADTGRHGPFPTDVLSDRGRDLLEVVGMEPSLQKSLDIDICFTCACFDAGRHSVPKHPSSVEQDMKHQDRFIRYHHADNQPKTCGNHRTTHSRNKQKGQAESQTRPTERPSDKKTLLSRNETERLILLAPVLKPEWASRYIATPAAALMGTRLTPVPPYFAASMTIKHGRSVAKVSLQNSPSSQDVGKMDGQAGGKSIMLLSSSRLCNKAQDAMQNEETKSMDEYPSSSSNTPP
ncbi:uncharacterized protein CLUP02_04636 [Colletotrichum lupini]|uniref:Uncharacterized protein n=1 Tax=Colletotrichum lupini TaxID=145971 RepID=A0A9Q8SMH0_9PEZI|nr:uncharacterized protein CLUP02_04636 [Colletotrichum lupini]UQC79157.1 hypothetical protein CLUP02_04636 [Colletotrichum lupini]